MQLRLCTHQVIGQTLVTTNHYHLLGFTSQRGSEEAARINMVFKFHCVAKISVILVLFSLWLINFALPSLKEYQAEQIIVTTAEEKMNDILAPAVTVCAQDTSLLVDDYHQTFQKYCANETDIRRCIDAATFNFSSTILHATKGLPPYDSSLMDPSQWIPEVTLPAAGICYMLKTCQRL